MIAAQLAAALLLLPGAWAPAGTTSAHGAGCGANIIGAAAFCLGWDMPRAQYDALVASATKGDNKAAWTLASFWSNSFEQSGQAQMEKWALLAAKRGYCNAIYWAWTESGRADAPIWKSRFQRLHCPRQSQVRWEVAH